MNKINKAKVLVLLIVLICFSIGTFFRLKNIADPGFVYDTITTQHTWAKSAVDRGFVDFWKNYQEKPELDYLPGSVYFGILIKSISKVFNDNPNTFATVLKSINFLVDIIFTGFIYLLCKKSFKRSQFISILISSLFYVFPSTWFVSGVWGQFDTLIALLLFASLFLLFSKWKYSYFLSGIVFAIALSLKLQPIIFMPVFLIVLLLKGDFKKSIQFLMGFIFTFGAINLFPFILNKTRTISVFKAPFIRDNTVSNGADTFWRMFSKIEKGDYTLLKISNFNLTVSFVGLLLFAFICIVSTFSVLNFKISSFFKKKLTEVYSSFLKMNKDFNFAKALILMIIVNFSYFMFMMKMHSRYLHFAALYSIIFLAFLKGRKFVFGLLTVILLTISYTLNQMYVYNWFYKEKFSPGFLVWIRSVPHFETYTSLVSLFCFIVFFVFMIKEGKTLKDENSESVINSKTGAQERS